MRQFRRERVASVIHEIVSEAIQNQLSDPRIDPMTTITRVEVGGDLAVATAYFVVAGDEASERRTLAALQHAQGHVRRLVAEGLTMRSCPELRFMVDVGAKTARETLRLIEQNRLNRGESLEDLEDDADSLDPDDAIDTNEAADDTA